MTKQIMNETIRVPSYLFDKLNEDFIDKFTIYNNMFWNDDTKMLYDDTYTILFLLYIVSDSSLNESELHDRQNDNIMFYIDRRHLNFLGNFFLGIPIKA